ncbi:c-type cytochrome [Sphingomonas sp. MMS24-J13]|uniref:c-type cytochrome n=1 Tax=Sphingomonas sp. MMS24-J13 TaxID=3238686 RepID=UPI00384E8772
MKKIILLIGAAAGLSSTIVGVASAQRFSGYPYQTGQEVYEHICQGCHMPDAKGATGAGTYPALASNPRLQAGVYPVIVMLRGQKAMPSFADLTDKQIADVTDYIRTHFGNQYPGTITPDQVGKMRPQQIKRDAQRPG